VSERKEKGQRQVELADTRAKSEALAPAFRDGCLLGGKLETRGNHCIVRGSCNRHCVGSHEIV